MGETRKRKPKIKSQRTEKPKTKQALQLKLPKNGSGEMKEIPTLWLFKLSKSSGSDTLELKVAQKSVLSISKNTNILICLIDFCIFGYMIEMP